MRAEHRAHKRAFDEAQRPARLAAHPSVKVNNFNFKTVIHRLTFLKNRHCFSYGPLFAKALGSPDPWFEGPPANLKSS